MSNKTLLATYRNSITLILLGLSLVNYVNLIGSEFTSMKDDVYLMMVGGIYLTLFFLIFKKYQEIKVCKPNISIITAVLIFDYLFVKSICDGDFRHNSLAMVISTITMVSLTISVVFELEE